MPTTIAAHGAARTTACTPSVMSAPTSTNTSRKPADTVPSTISPRPSPIAEVGVGVSLSSSPMKYDRWAGSIAKPHGLTVATSPAVNASANGSPSPVQMLVDEVAQLRFRQQARMPMHDRAVGVDEEGARHRAHLELPNNFPSGSSPTS